MTKAKEFTLYLYRHHFVRYLLVGGTTFVIDFGILVILHGHLKLNLGTSASVSYWVSIIYNFALNRYWTFDSREKDSLARHISTYMILLILNYLFTVTFVSVVGAHINYIIAKALAVGIQMIWTYPIYKKYIFVAQAKTS
ncbi:MAG TPA: GtrA family protein [Candidatus Saccharimonadales bacterium]|nr:GtrA family protein [Candidatus Saccharimonadales bacterium]